MGTRLKRDIDTESPPTLCPRFDRCAANVCPLDPAQDRMRALPGEERCTLGKARRRRIAAEYSAEMLPRRGLTTREASGEARWAAMTDDERAAKVQVLSASYRVSGNEPGQAGDCERDTHSSRESRTAARRSP